MKVEKRKKIHHKICIFCGFYYNNVMIYPILIVFGVILVLVLVLAKISPFSSDFTIEVPQQDEKIIEKVVEIEKIVEDTTKINELQQEIDKLTQKLQELAEKPQDPNISSGKIYRNIGLEMFHEKDLDKFNVVLNEIIGKNVLFVTDSSFLLGENFKDHKIYEGVVTKYDIIKDRYPDHPIVRFWVRVPSVLGNTNINLQWVYDSKKLDLDFSSPKLVSEFLKTKEPKSELFLIEI